LRTLAHLTLGLGAREMERGGCCSHDGLQKNEQSARRTALYTPGLRNTLATALSCAITCRRLSGSRNVRRVPKVLVGFPKCSSGSQSARRVPKQALRILRNFGGYVAEVRQVKPVSQQQPKHGHLQSPTPRTCPPYARCARRARAGGPPRGSRPCVSPHLSSHPHDDPPHHLPLRGLPPRDDPPRGDPPPRDSRRDFSCPSSPAYCNPCPAHTCTWTWSLS
jgi:hypothetical protein